MPCDPLPNSSNSPVLAEASDEQGRLVLLYVAADKDLPEIVKLLKKEYSPEGDLNAALEGFREMFSSFAGSGKSQAFLVWLGDTALIEIEIHDAQMHFPDRTDFTPDAKDYFMNLMAGDFDQAEFPVYVRGFRMCLEYFWKFLAVQQILALVNSGPHQQLQGNLFTSAGMTMPLGITNPDQPDLYLIARPQQ